jgi:hypothetical protein
MDLVLVRENNQELTQEDIELRDSIFDDEDSMAALRKVRPTMSLEDFNKLGHDQLNELAGDIAKRLEAEKTHKEFIETVQNYDFALVSQAAQELGMEVKTVKQLNELGDSEIYYCPLPQMNPRQEGVGVHGHPDYLSHLISALALSDFLYENTFFSPDYTATLQDAVLIAAQYLPPEHSALTDAAALIATGCDNDRARGTVQAIIDACIVAFTAE